MWMSVWMGAWGKANTKSIECMCQLLMIAKTSIRRTVPQLTTGLWVDQQSTNSIERCPPAQSLAFHLTISPTGFRFCFIDQTIGNGTLLFGTCLSGTTFQCLHVMWSSSSFLIAAMNCSRSGCFSASFKFIVSGSEAGSAFVCSENKAIGSGSSFDSTSGWRSWDWSELGCGKKVCKNVAIDPIGEDPVRKVRQSGRREIRPDLV